MAAELDPNQPHDLRRERKGEAVRVACSCGWLGQWRRGYEERGLHSDAGEHVHAVRRAKAAAAQKGGES